MEMFERETVLDSKMSSDLETDGFDLSAGRTWIYPENYPIRDYQYNIVEAALYNNTLVCLPTGLGKTFIAAVVMYNFWRWYPQGKVIFLAPTKPLVAQQIHACHNTMGIPSIETIELTGAVSNQKREVAWNKKRVIFATPQVFENDLQKAILPAKMVKCVVIDEAHKALGKHSYCECIRLLYMQHQYFRILGLSATPGNKIASVQEVLQKLHISHLELRDETSHDIKPYINQRKVDIILVPLSDELAQYKERYILIMDRHVKVLIQNNILHSHTANISKGRIFHLSKEIRNKTNKSGNYGSIVKTLNILLTMYHAYELMIRHGLRAFHKFYENHSDKFWMNNEHNLQTLLEDMKHYLGPFPDSQSLLHGVIPDVPKNLIFGHNKFHKLKELLLEHFERAAKTQISTRAIVFVEYKDIVYEVYVLLLQTRPLIRPQIFVGNTGQKQKQQKQALENFRNDCVNVLISTSIGEEGLDVGEVDLIICFDATPQSPIRLVQRMGRTGRKRDGHIIVLVTDGKEHESLKSTMARRDSLNNRILNTSNILTSLYEYSPRMIPTEFKPECHKIHINTQLKGLGEKKRGRKPTVEKKKTKVDAVVKRNDDKLKWSKSDSKSITQMSMTTFLKGSQCSNQLTNSCTAINSVTRCDSGSKKIDESNITLLSSDNDIIEFLTLCAMKKSEKEMSTDECRKIDTSYIPLPLPIDNFFDFNVPNVKILENISSLSDKIPISLPINDENNEIDANNVGDNDFWCTNFRQIPSPFEQTDECTEFGESRFEDILDESSDPEELETICPVGNRENLGNDRKQLPLITTLIPDVEPTYSEIIIGSSPDSPNSDEWILSAIKESDISECKTNIDHYSDVLVTHKQGGLAEKAIYDTEILKRVTLDIACEENIFQEDAEKIVRGASIKQSMREINETINNGEALKDALKYVELDNRNDNAKIDANEIKEADFDWDSDFETPTVAIRNVESFKNQNTSIFTEIRQRNSGTGLSLKNIDVEDENSSDWISIKSTSRAHLKENTTPRLSRKLLARRKLLNSTRSPIRTILREAVDSDDDFSFTSSGVNKLNQLESDYFGKKKIHNTPHCTSTPAKEEAKGSILSLRKNNPCTSSCVSSSNSSNEQRSTLKLNTDSGNSFAVKRTCTLGVNNKIKKQEFQRRKNEFLDDEAGVSFNGSSDESSETDEDLGDFVSYTQDVQDAVDMQAHYLQAVKSPAARPGNFLFKPPTLPIEDINIYSQPLSDENETYVYDSFCVETTLDETNISSQASEYSLLEKAERILAKRKRKRCNVEENSNNTGKRLKKINVLNKSTSSEDEIEKLREQIRENSK